VLQLQRLHRDGLAAHLHTGADLAQKVGHRGNVPHIRNPVQHHRFFGQQARRQRR